jgi:hypothetical protein
MSMQSALRTEQLFNLPSSYIMADLRCSNCSSYLFNGPVQCSCGDRLCGDCYNRFKSRWASWTVGCSLYHVYDRIRLMLQSKILVYQSQCHIRSKSSFKGWFIVKSFNNSSKYLKLILHKLKWICWQLLCCDFSAIKLNFPVCTSC